VFCYFEPDRDVTRANIRDAMVIVADEKEPMICVIRPPDCRMELPTGIRLQTVSNATVPETDTKQVK
jgi:hypothetical protein